MYEETGMGKVDAGVAGLAGPIAERLGLELVEVEYRKVAGSWQLRVIIDKESGVGVEDCQAFSEELSCALDETDLVPSSYLLEVSSPGIERPLKKAADFQRFAGKRVQVVAFAPVHGQKRLVGELLGLVEDEIKLRLESGEEVGIPFTAVARARLAPKF
jgi:ribosome maturation factor RimP